MNVHHQRRLTGGGRSSRFALGLVASAAMALVLLAALYLSAPHAGTVRRDALAPTGAVTSSHAVLSSGTGEAPSPATKAPGSRTFHEDADLSRLAPEPDPSAAAVAAY